MKTQALTEKNAQLSRELQDCKAQLEAALAAAGGDAETPPGNTFLLINISAVRRARKSNSDIAGAAGQDPDMQELLRQLKAGERVLNRVQQERNKLQDANAKLGEELKGARAELSGSVKENQRLRRGIYSKCLSGLL